MKRIIQFLKSGIAAVLFLIFFQAAAQHGPTGIEGQDNKNSQTSSTISVILEQDDDYEVDAQGYCMIPIRSLQKLELGSISLVIDFPCNELEIEDVASKIKGKMLYSLYDGMLRISWYSMVPIKINPGDELIALKCRNISLNPLFNAKRHQHIADDLRLRIHPISMICDGNSVHMPNVVLTYPRISAK
jgi:hypothetical protein